MKITWLSHQALDPDLRHVRGTDARDAGV